MGELVAKSISSFVSRRGGALLSMPTTTRRLPGSRRHHAAGVDVDDGGVVGGPDVEVGLAAEDAVLLDEVDEVGEGVSGVVAEVDFEEALAEPVVGDGVVDVVVGELRDLELEDVAGAGAVGLGDGVVGGTSDGVADGAVVDDAEADELGPDGGADSLVGGVVGDLTCFGAVPGAAAALADLVGALGAAVVGAGEDDGLGVEDRTLGEELGGCREDAARDGDGRDGLVAAVARAQAAAYPGVDATAQLGVGLGVGLLAFARGARLVREALG
eukprot:CAMPEP_0198665208 /NCGR_PEP_ID=MMETSP1467-20131203/59481_1 /TAXON_ID=1462469 /ORGANISM="unid. sp., Strain CCMP2135" /LENGTH=270 /DNA_ID=CAMNT_0044401795 /DNA_START=48 /DNA_END=856 /DNA_ORIENTATION=+